jgi:hypothetical protein
MKTVKRFAHARMRTQSATRMRLQRRGLGMVFGIPQLRKSAKLFALFLMKRGGEIGTKNAINIPFEYQHFLTAMSDFADEEHCALCSRMWPSEREGFRANLDTLPLLDGVCDACQMAFWRNMGLPVRDGDATEH